MTTDNEDWISLNGCNACVNSHVCNTLGNCVVLSVDQVMPEYCKAKRKLLTRIRVYGNGSMEQLRLILKKAKKEQTKQEIIYTAPRLTRLEQLFIEQTKDYARARKNIVGQGDDYP